MSRLGIEEIHGFIYEGRSAANNLAHPQPLVSQCVLAESPGAAVTLPDDVNGPHVFWLFREDSFDPVSRIRRGRLYQPASNTNPVSQYVYAHPNSPSDYREVAPGHALAKRMSLYIQCTQLLAQPHQGQGLQLILGTRAAHGYWRILHTEMTAHQDVLVTLRAESVFAVLPDLILSDLPLDGQSAIRDAYARVIDVAYRSSSTSVVDQCRNLCQVALGRILHSKSGTDKYLSLDLGQCISAIRNVLGERKTLCDALSIVNKLHARGKDNAQIEHGTREVVSGDAELALHATAFSLRDLQLAR